MFVNAMTAAMRLREFLAAVYGDKYAEDAAALGLRALRQAGQQLLERLPSSSEWEVKRDVLRLYLGVADGYPYAPAEIGRMLGLNVNPDDIGAIGVAAVQTFRSQRT